MIVRHNQMAANTSGRIKINENAKMKCFEKLSSGYRINRAADDAANLTISEKMRSQIRGLQQGENNVRDGISFVQTAEGALSEIHGMMHRIHELAVQAANDTNTPEDRKCIDEEIQHYKQEIDYMFRETEFNTIKIWDTDTQDRVQIGTERKQAVKLNMSNYQYISVTEKNKGAISFDGYEIQVLGTDKNDAGNYGFKIIWEGWNKKQYSSALISWDEAAADTSFDLNLKDYLDPNDAELKGIDFHFGWKSEETATVDDLKAALDGVRFGTYENSSEAIDLNGNKTNYNDDNNISFSINTNYLSELAGDRNVEAYDTSWIEPEITNGTNVISQPSYNDPNEIKGWEIQFNMKNIGTVTARSKRMEYRCPIADKDYEGTWWQWVYPKNGKRYQSTITRYPDTANDGTMRSVTDCITDAANDGDSFSKNLKKGHYGYVYLHFDITPDNSASYMGRDITSIGTMEMCIKVEQSDTEQTLMDKIGKLMANNCVIDAFEGNESAGTPYRTTHTVCKGSEKKHMIDVPVYRAAHDRAIQAGANSGQQIHIRYETYRLINLGIADSNVLTREAAEQTISDIQDAEMLISEQRGLFGAYQNRLEHAMEVDAGTAENLQDSESRIRDTDMASEAVSNAGNNILGQSMQAMLANANRSQEGVLALLP